MKNSTEGLDDKAEPMSQKQSVVHGDRKQERKSPEN